jgi:hypothetical protein
LQGRIHLWFRGFLQGFAGARADRIAIPATAKAAGAAENATPLFAGR